MPTSHKLYIGLPLFLAGLSAVAVILSLLPGRPLVPEAAAITLILLALPFAIGGTWRCYRVGISTRGLEFIWLLWQTPRRLLAVAGTIVAGAVLAVGLGSAQVSGQPVQTPNGHYVRDHGKLQPVSRAEYESALKADVRSLATGAAVVFAVSALLAAAVYRGEEENLARWRRDQAAGDGAGRGRDGD